MENSTAAKLSNQNTNHQVIKQKASKLINTVQAQKLLGLKSRSGIYRLIDLGLIPKTFRAEDESYLFDVQDILNLMLYRFHRQNTTSKSANNRPNGSLVKLKTRASNVKSSEAKLSETKPSEVKSHSDNSCCKKHKECCKTKSTTKESTTKESTAKEIKPKTTNFKDAIAKRIETTDFFLVDVPLEYFRKSKESDAVFQEKYLGLAAMTVWAPQELLIRFKEKVKNQDLTFRSVFKDFFEDYIKAK